MSWTKGIVAFVISTFARADKGWLGNMPPEPTDGVLEPACASALTIAPLAVVAAVLAFYRETLHACALTVGGGRAEAARGASVRVRRQRLGTRERVVESKGWWYAHSTTGLTTRSA